MSLVTSHKNVNHHSIFRNTKVHIKTRKRRPRRMRSLIVTLLYLLLAMATARQDKSPTTEVTTAKPSVDNVNDDMWIYPPGWGLGGCPSSSYCSHAHEQEDKTKKVKPVKRAQPRKKQADTPSTPENPPGWFGVRSDPRHPHWKDVEEVMDGLE